MQASAITLTKSNLNLSSGKADALEAKVDYNDGSSDFNYRVTLDKPEIAAVQHVGAQIIVQALAAGTATLRIVANKSADIAAEVKINVGGGQIPPLPNPPPQGEGKIKKEFLPLEGGGKVGVAPAEISNDQFIAELYRDILHRPADEVGKRYWTKMLASKSYTRDEVRQAFAESPEAKGK